MRVLAGDDNQIIDQLMVYQIIKAPQKDLVIPLLPLIRSLELTSLDYLTIGDLMRYAQCPGDLPLAMILMAMFAALAEGSLCIDLDQPMLAEEHIAENDAVLALFSDFLSRVAAGIYDKVISTDGTAYLPLILDTAHERRLLYFQKYYIHEKRLMHRLATLLNAPVSLSIADSTIEGCLADIYSLPLSIRIGPDRTPNVRDPVQTDAIRLALKNQFSIISGGPGTGKTSLMVNILRCLVRQGIPAGHIVLGAPTGRAAQRMTEAVRSNMASIEAPSVEDATLATVKGSTLHKILEYGRRRHAFHYRQANPLPASVLVIDEVSMVDVAMLDHLLQAVDPGQTKVILLGDKHQLPSVEAGAMFADMVPDEAHPSGFRERFVELQKVYRSGRQLLTLSKKINSGECPDLEPAGFEQALSQAVDQWAFVQADGDDRWRTRLGLWAQTRYLASGADAERFAAMIAEAGKSNPGRLVASAEGIALLDRIFGVIEQARILSVLRNGIYGCTVINDLIAEYLIPHCDPGVAKPAAGFAGAVIIITRNDYSKDLFNGDVGVLIKDTGGSYHAVFRRAATYISFPLNLLPTWELAFAITVHKSQGSEFDDVMLVLPEDENHRLLTREIVYTAVTRAKKRVILYGSSGALNKALKRRVRRQSGLMMM